MSAKHSLNSATNQNKIRSTTVVCVRRGNSVVMAADGQVTLGEGVIKHTARKIAEEAMKIAGKICIFTNDNVTVEELSSVPEKADTSAPVL